MTVKFTPIRGLRNFSSKTIKDLKNNPMIITNRGKPEAALIPLNEDLLEDFIVGNVINDKLEAAIKEFDEKGGYTIEEAEEILGL